MSYATFPSSAGHLAGTGEERGSFYIILGAGRAGDPSQSTRKRRGSSAFSAHPPYEAKQMQGPTLKLGW